MSRETVLVYADELEKLRHRLVGIQTYVRAKKIVAIVDAADKAVDIIRETLPAIDVAPEDISAEELSQNLDNCKVAAYL
jgi:hypothetical protein